MCDNLKSSNLLIRECVINRTGFLIDCLCLVFAQVSVKTLPKHAKNYLTKTNKKSQLSHVKQISYTVHNMCNLRMITRFGSGHQSGQPCIPQTPLRKEISVHSVHPHSAEKALNKSMEYNLEPIFTCYSLQQNMVFFF
jgi:hypothetical protein